MIRSRPYRLIAHPTWLQEAARQALASRGSKTAGIDGVTKTMLLPQLERCLAVLREDLLEGTHRPSPAKRIYIQKANGKLRPLGIPTLKDRIVQRAMLMVMSRSGKVTSIRCPTDFGPSAVSITRFAP